jgi:hypothetical protein
MFRTLLVYQFIMRSMTAFQVEIDEQQLNNVKIITSIEVSLEISPQSDAYIGSSWWQQHRSALVASKF